MCGRCEGSRTNVRGERICESTLKARENDDDDDDAHLAFCARLIDPKRKPNPKREREREKKMRENRDGHNAHLTWFQPERVDLHRKILMVGWSGFCASLLLSLRVKRGMKTF